LKYNKESRLTFTYLYENIIKKNYIIENETKNSKYELIDYIKKKFNIDTMKKDSDRFNRCIFLDLSLKNFSTFFQQEVYFNFVNQYTEIKNKDIDNTLTKKSANKYLYYIKFDDIFAIFKKYINENNIPKIYKFERGGEDKLYKNEFIKYICKYTNAEIKEIRSFRNYYKIFIGIILK